MKKMDKEKSELASRVAATEEAARQDAVYGAPKTRI